MNNSRVEEKTLKWQKTKCRASVEPTMQLQREVRL